MTAAATAASGVLLTAERVHLLASQTSGAVLVVLIGSCLIVAVLLLAGIPRLEALAWIAVFVGTNAYRVAVSRRVLAGAVPRNEAMLRRYLAFAIVNGVWAGGLPALFFSRLPDEASFALTALVLLAAAGSAATYGSYPRGQQAYLLLAMPPLIVAWGLHGGPQSWLIVVTLSLYTALMLRFGRQLGSVFERSVTIRYEREQVVQQLQQEKLETDRARREAEDANLAKSRFLANASHDLRQPAHALNLYSALLLNEARTDRDRHIALNVAESSRALRELLDSLLEVSELDAGAIAVSPRAVALGPLLREIEHEARALVAGRPIRIDVDSPPLVMETDPVQLKRILRNLVHNAVKFTEQGQVRLRAETGRGWLELVVEDSGPGIAPQHHALVFEEFYQVGNSERNRARGLGLGLSIVRRIAALLGGEVGLRSEPGRGAAFTLRLPYIQREAGELPPELGDPDDALDLGGLRVLVIDDDPMVRESMRLTLEGWHARVELADGLVRAREQPGARSGWALCLCDLRLRGGEDGVETASALRRDQPGLPVILVTGDTEAPRIGQAAGSGFALLHKPVPPRLLADRIRAVLQAAVAP